MKDSEAIKSMKKICPILNSTAKVFLLFITLFFGLVSHAQENDNLVINTNNSDIELKTQLFDQPIAFSKVNIKNFTHTEVYFHLKKNEFSRKQTASQTNTYGFQANGLYNVNSSFKILGEISAEKIEEKNVAWIQSEERTEDVEVINTMYFFVPKSGDWSNQRYRIKAAVIKNFADFEIAVKANLFADKFNRTKRDPRPDITRNTLSGELQLGYNFYQNHHVYGRIGINRLNRDYNTYYNNSLINNETQPEYYLRFNAGYGRVINSPIKGTTTFNSFNQEITKKIGGGYNYQSNQTLLNATYLYQRGVDNLYNEKLKDADKKIFQMRNITHLFNLYFQTKQNRFTYSSNLSFSDQEVLNYDIKNLGSNYKSIMRKAQLTSEIKKHNHNFIAYSFGLRAVYNQNKYVDLLAYLDMKIAAFELSIFGEKDIKINNNQKINFALSVNYYTPLEKHLNYISVSGNDENSFVEEVVKYDYIYSTTNRLESDFSIRYIRNIKNAKTVVFYTGFKNIFALETDKNIDFNTAASYQINFGLQLNY